MSQNNGLLKFGKGNAKLGKSVHTFSILSGWTCPAAKDCLSKVYVNNGKRTLKDGPDTEFRCFSASQEVVYTGVYNSRKHNIDMLRGKTREEMVKLLTKSIPAKSDIIRIHVAGDFFNQNYFDAWCQTAKDNPEKLFYAYTKSLKYWLDARKRKIIPKNLVLTASYGGRHDNLIKKNKLRYAQVVYSVKEAEDLGLEIDHDDTHAMKRGDNFALLIHGVQPKGSKAGKAVRDLAGLGSYGKKGKND